MSSKKFNGMDTTHVWQTFSGQLLGWFRKQGVQPADADDLLQEVFIKVHQKLPTLATKERLGPWLYRVAKNQLIDYFRASGRNQLVLQQQPAEMPPENQTEDYQALTACLRSMAAALPESYRKPLLLADYKGVKQQEVAQQLGLGLSATKSRIQRARRMLRQQLQQCCHANVNVQEMAQACANCN